MSIWEVTPQESGQKLVAYLRSKLSADYSLRRIKEAIEQNACTINGRIERFASTVVAKGDKIAFTLVNKQDVASAVIIYQDNYLLACNKPAGVSSEDPLLKPSPELILLHRLDKDTTGVLLWAKNSLIAEKMLLLFKERLVKKSYLAIVDGVPKQKVGRIENQLGKVCQYQGQSLWGPVKKGLTAITDWRTVKEFRSAALLACSPQTGRTHQLRVHLSGIGHPILGDKQYSKNPKSSFRPSRCLLHAARVEFIHPATGTPLTIEAELPADFKLALETIGAK
jgi:23S rRNA pseudouridine955/2504/2580 synthase/23S rRNA pseudouridine1911/1915/1917 synthase